MLTQIHSINHNIEPVILGSTSSMLMGEAIKGTEITGSQPIDICIKIAVPIITGVLIPLVNEWIKERKQRRINHNKKSRL